MKIRLCFVIAVCLMLSLLVISGYAVNETESVFYYSDREIQVLSSDNLSYSDMKFIADSIAYGDDDAPTTSVQGIACIFGHKLTNTTVVETVHNAYSTSPKCVRNTYSVEYCTRSSCDYINRTLICSTRIAGCHG